MLWDLQGDDEFQRLRSSYLRGRSACFCRNGTSGNAVDCMSTESKFSPSPTVPRILAVNKADTQAEWEIEEPDLCPLCGMAGRFCARVPKRRKA